MSCCCGGELLGLSQTFLKCGVGLLSEGWCDAVCYYSITHMFTKAKILVRFLLIVPKRKHLDCVGYDWEHMYISPASFCAYSVTNKKENCSEHTLAFQFLVLRMQL